MLPTLKCPSTSSGYLGFSIISNFAWRLQPETSLQDSNFLWFKEFSSFFAENLINAADFPYFDF